MMCERESVAIAAIMAALEKMPERSEWDRIVVAMPGTNSSRGKVEVGPVRVLEPDDVKK